MHTLLDRHRPTEGWPITKAVMFALGHFMSGSSNSFLWYKSVAQLVVFLDIVDCRTILLALQLSARQIYMRR